MYLSNVSAYFEVLRVKSFMREMWKLLIFILLAVHLIVHDVQTNTEVNIM
jgi:uncharacterized membrane protein